MKGDDVCTRFGKQWNQRVHRFNHQMHINWDGHMRANRLADQRPDGQIGHIVVVHHIKVYPVRASRLDGFNFRAEFGKISR